MDKILLVLIAVIGLFLKCYGLKSRADFYKDLMNMDTPDSEEENIDSNDK